MEAVGCDWLINELGPPPDAILRIPPPPVPSFMDLDYLNDMTEAMGSTDEQSDLLHNDSFCHWCHWARRVESTAGTGITGTSGTEMALEDTWFFVILASCLMLTLGALLSGLVYLRLHGKSFKGAWDFGGFLSDVTAGGSSILMGSPVGQSSTTTPVSQQRAPKVRRCSSNSCEVHPTAGPQQPAVMDINSTSAVMMASSRALWAGVKTASEGNHYTITHAQPLFEPKRSSSVIHPAAASSNSSISTPTQPDEDSAGYTTLQPVMRNSPSENEIYYCCTDLMRPIRINQPVTSLDDPNPLYVNMSASAAVIHHAGRPAQRTYLPVNPIYPTTSPCGQQHPLYQHRVSSTLHVHPHVGRMVYQA